MNFLDNRTILIGAVISDALFTLVISSLWLQHRRQSPELWLCTADFALQTVAILLIALRVPSPMYGYRFGLAVPSSNKQNSGRLLQRWGALFSCTFWTSRYISFMCYRSERSLSLIHAQREVGHAQATQ